MPAAVVTGAGLGAAAAVAVAGERVGVGVVGVLVELLSLSFSVLVLVLVGGGLPCRERRAEVWRQPRPYLDRRARGQGKRGAWDGGRGGGCRRFWGPSLSRRAGRCCAGDAKRNCTAVLRAAFKRLALCLSRLRFSTPPPFPPSPSLPFAAVSGAKSERNCGRQGSNQICTRRFSRKNVRQPERTRHLLVAHRRSPKFTHEIHTFTRLCLHMSDKRKAYKPSLARQRRCGRAGGPPAGRSLSPHRRRRRPS